MKKRITGVLAICLVLTMSGCGAINSLFSKEPSTPKGLMDVVHEKMADQNFAMEGKMTMDMSISFQGTTLSFPIEFAVEGQFLGKDSHTEMTMNGEFMGESVTQTNEIYVSEDDTYKSENGGPWSKSPTSEDGNMVDAMVSIIEDVEVFDEAEMEDGDAGYTIKMDITDIFTDELFEYITDAGESELMPGFSDFDPEMITDGKLTYQISSDYLLSGFQIEDFTFEMEDIEGNDGASFEMVMNVDMELSDHGKVSNSDVEIPEEVLDAVNSVMEDNKESGEIDDSMILPFASSGDSESNEDPNVTIDDGMDNFMEKPSTDRVDGGDINPSTDSSTDSLRKDSVFGIYNGTPLVPGSMNYDTFSEEFELDNYSEDELYGFLPMESKYNEYVDLYLYDKVKTGTVDGAKSGVYGYEMSILPGFGEDGVLPDISFNGITWGSSMEDVIAVYGEPDYKYSSTDYWSVSYDIEELNTDDAGYELEFSGSGTGVNSFALKYFSYIM